MTVDTQGKDGYERNVLPAINARRTSRESIDGSQPYQISALLRERET